MGNDLETRMLALERENRRLKVLGLFLFIAAGLTRTISAESSSDVVRARSVEIIDKAGVVRAKLSTEVDGRPSFYFLDEEKKQRFLLAMFPGGNPVMQLTADSGEVAQISRPLAGKSFFRVRDKNRDVIWEMP